jgi:hypothetical protein
MAVKQETKTIINVEQGQAIPPSTAIINRELSEYGASINDFKIKATNYKIFIDILKDVYDVVEESYKVSKFQDSFYIRDKQGAFMVIGELVETFYIFDIYTRNFETNHFIFKMIKHLLELSSDTEIIYTTAYNSATGIGYNTKVLDDNDFVNIKKEYYPYINIDEMFSQFFKYDENILCLIGIPGCGKSKMSTLMMSYLLENTHLLKNNMFDYDVLYVKSETALTDDAFWVNMESSSYNLVILDDLDNLLGSRDVVNTQADLDKNKFISNLLSYTDGVNKNNTKFIITTNQDIKNIDKAILRKGRMFDILELRPLNYKEALDIWESYGLDLDLYPDVLETGTVLQADLGSEIEKYLKDANPRQSYLLEEDISKMGEFNKERKVGL